MDTPRLNLDVLYILLSFLRNRELMQLSRTCKAYRPIVLKRIVSSQDVYIHRRNKLTSFCTCILADVTTRAPWIKRLSMSFEAFLMSYLDNNMGVRYYSEASVIEDISNVSSLAVILEHCQGLRGLTIPSLDQLLLINPQIGSSIASLPVLQDLHLDRLNGSPLTNINDPPLIAQTIFSLQSQLNALHLWGKNGKIPDCPLYNPSAFVSTANITVLHLEAMTFPPRTEAYSPWPSVREFFMRGCVVDMSKMPLVLPNLRFLELSNRCEWLENHWAGTPLWPDLDHFIIQGPIHQEKQWTQGCRIRRLELLTNGVFERHNNAEEAARFLEACQPIVLSLNLVHADEDLFAALGEFAPDLRFLQFTFRGLHISTSYSDTPCHCFPLYTLHIYW